MGPGVAGGAKGTSIRHIETERGKVAPRLYVVGVEAFGDTAALTAVIVSLQDGALPLSVIGPSSRLVTGRGRVRSQ
jgi:hypothetical protein